MLKREQNKGWSFVCMILGIAMSVCALIVGIYKESMFDILCALCAGVFAAVNAYNLFNENGIGAFRIDLEVDYSNQEEKKSFDEKEGKDK